MKTPERLNTWQIKLLVRLDGVHMPLMNESHANNLHHDIGEVLHDYLMDACNLGEETLTVQCVATNRRIKP